METITYTGENRELFLYPNNGIISINNGDIINCFIDLNGRKKFKINSKQYPISNIVPMLKYGFWATNSFTAFIDVIKGQKLSQYEFDKICIKTGLSNLPKSDFFIGKWQSNYVIPVMKYVYKNGIYYNEYNWGRTANELVWEMYYNAMKIVPNEKVSYVDFEKLPTLWENERLTHDEVFAPNYNYLK